ncbi:hypothetical protein RDWZM_005761, partial [Blomia tropicalis]
LNHHQETSFFHFILAHIDIEWGVSTLLFNLPANSSTHFMIESIHQAMNDSILWPPKLLDESILCRRIIWALKDDEYVDDQLNSMLVGRYWKRLSLASTTVLSLNYVVVPICRSIAYYRLVAFNVPSTHLTSPHLLIQ